MSKAIILCIATLLLFVSAGPVPSANSPASEASDAVFLRSPQDDGSGKSDAVFLRSAQSDDSGAPSDAIFLRNAQAETSGVPSDAVFLRSPDRNVD